MTAPAPKRTFVALHVPDAITESLVGVQESLKRRLQAAEQSRRAGPSVRWIVRQQMHITLCFLGDTRDDQLEPLRAVVARLAHDRAALRLAVGETLEIFGTPRRARALVASVVGPDAAQLTALQQELALRVKEHGFEPERRPYTPHITLARFKPAGDVGHWLGEEALHLTPKPFLGETLRFYHSVLTPQGGVYELLGEAPLGVR